MLKLLFSFKLRKTVLSRNSDLFSFVNFILSVHGCDDSQVSDNVFRL